MKSVLFSSVGSCAPTVSGRFARSRLGGVTTINDLANHINSANQNLISLQDQIQSISHRLQDIDYIPQAGKNAYKWIKIRFDMSDLVNRRL